MLFNVKFPLPEFASRVLCLTASSRATPWTLVISKFIYTETPLAQSSRTWCCITWGNAALLLNPPLFIPGCSPKPWLLRNKEHVLLLTFFPSPNPSWLYSFRGCQHPGIHLFFRLHSPAVLSVPEVVHDPKSCLTFWGLFSFHSIHGTCARVLSALWPFDGLETLWPHPFQGLLCSTSSSWS